jgi:hypothetical protein
MEELDRSRARLSEVVAAEAIPEANFAEQGTVRRFDRDKDHVGHAYHGEAEAR